MAVAGALLKSEFALLVAAAAFPLVKCCCWCCCCAVQDKNAAPLNQLDVLMEEVYDQIMELADKVGACAQQVVQGHQAGIHIRLKATMQPNNWPPSSGLPPKS